MNSYPLCRYRSSPIARLCTEDIGVVRVQGVVLTWFVISILKLLIGIDVAVDNYQRVCYQIMPCHSLSPPPERATLQLLPKGFEAWLGAFCLSELTVVLKLLAWSLVDAGLDRSKWWTTIWLAEQCCSGIERWLGQMPYLGSRSLMWPSITARA